MDGGGFVFLWRKTLDSAVFQEDGLYRLWTYCVLRASAGDTELEIPEFIRPLKLKRGQFITGRQKLHQALYPKNRPSDPAPSTVWRRLLRLEKAGNLLIQPSSLFSVVTVCNYSDYNDRDMLRNPESAQAVAREMRTIKSFTLEIQEQELLKKWNSTKGAKNVTEIAFHMLRPDLRRARLGDPAWVEHYPRALDRFPLPAFPNGVALPTFLEDGFAGNVLAGRYDDRYRSKNGQPASKVDVQAALEGIDD